MLKSYIVYLSLYQCTSMRPTVLMLYIAVHLVCVCVYIYSGTIVVELLSLITGAFRSAEGLFPRNTADAQAVYDSVLRHYLLHVPLEFNPSWFITHSAPPAVDAQLDPTTVLRSSIHQSDVPRGTVGCQVR